MNKTENRGGRRDGSGRRPTEAARVNLTVRVAPETKLKINYLRRAGFKIGELVDESVAGLWETICSDIDNTPDDL